MMVTNFYVLKTNKKNIAHLMYDRKIIKCKVGKNGIGIKTREGDRVTPRGTYKFFEVFYRSDRVNDIKPKIPTPLSPVSIFHSGGSPIAKPNISEKVPVNPY